MTGRYSDFEELRPTGEASHIPDDRLTDCGDGEPRRQRVATNRAGYPDAPTESESKCRSCGASIPTTQTKCRFCLTNHLGEYSPRTDAESAEETLLGVIHIIVESSTFYGAVAKGGAATKLIASSEAEQAVDDCTLIYDLDEEPVPQLAERWPTLPAAVQIASAAGERLLTVTRDQNWWAGRLATETRQETTPRLYDESGTGIRDEQDHTTLTDDTDDETWLVPAIALHEAADENDVNSHGKGMPIGESLECQRCGRATDHKFSESESLPDETWSGQPIWECQVCGTSRYGPTPTNRG